MALVWGKTSRANERKQESSALVGAIVFKEGQVEVGQFIHSAKATSVPRLHARLSPRSTLVTCLFSAEHLPQPRSRCIRVIFGVLRATRHQP
jgi:hypothetical protein